MWVLFGLRAQVMFLRLAGESVLLVNIVSEEMSISLVMMQLP
jgi:hypothetical protein